MCSSDLNHPWFLVNLSGFGKIEAVLLALTLELTWRRTWPPPAPFLRAVFASVSRRAKLLVAVFDDLLAGRRRRPAVFGLAVPP